MMEWLLYPLIYIAVKLAAYGGWCRFGIHLMASDEELPFRRSILLAIVRIAIGFGFGWLLMFPMMWAFPGSNRIGFAIPQYVVALCLLRWIEWSAISVLLRRARMRQLFRIRSKPDLFWRLGGLALSFLTDAAMITVIAEAGLIPC